MIRLVQKSVLYGFISTIFLALVAPSVFAQRQRVDVASLNPNTVDIYLVTINVGDLVFNNFGHTALRIKDEGQYFDQVFNWGIFDFQDPLSFSYRFYRGILRYELGVYPFSLADRQFRMERRTVWQEKVNLTTEQKTVLLKRIAWNLQPENVAYDYYYFFDNCSTRIRDYIDEAIGGALRQGSEKVRSGRTYRDTVRSHYASNPEIALSLDLLMNHRIDPEMNKWEEMYLPIVMREVMLNFSHNGPEGNTLLTGSEILLEYPGPKIPLLNGWAFATIFIFAPLLIGNLICWRKRDVTTAHKCLAAWSIVPMFYFGLAGLLMVATWIWSAHLDLHHNAALWFFWPTDLALLVPLFGLMMKKKGATLGFLSSRYRLYVYAHALLAILALILWAVGVIDQQIERVVFFLLPIQVLVLLLIYRLSASHDVKAKL